VLNLIAIDLQLYKIFKITSHFFWGDMVYNLNGKIMLNKKLKK